MYLANEKFKYFKNNEYLKAFKGEFTFKGEINKKTLGGQKMVNKTTTIKKNTYKVFKDKQSEKINSFPMFFAFNDEQFKEGKLKLGVKEDNELLSIFGGGFIRKSDREAYKNLWSDLNAELEQNMKEDLFLFNAFRYELSNHEFIITGDYKDTLNVFGLEYDKLTDRELKMLQKAKEDYLKAMEECE